jgi:hypothetical protein
MRIRNEAHAGDAGGLDIPTRKVETIPDDGTGQAVPGYRHYREFFPRVCDRIVRLEGAKRSHKMAVLVFSTGHIDPSFVDSPCSSAPLGRHACFHQAPLVGSRIVFLNNIGVAGGEK